RAGSRPEARRSARRRLPRPAHRPSRPRRPRVGGSDRSCRAPARTAAAVETGSRRARLRARGARAEAHPAGRGPSLLKILECAVDVERMLVDLALRLLLVAVVPDLAKQLLRQLVDRRLHVTRCLSRAQGPTFQPPAERNADAAAFAVAPLA